MLNLVTGLPGHGKTLWTLNAIRKLEKESGRRVFYWNIPECKFAWEKLDNPDQWHELPEGAIVLMDEAQKVFPVRAHTAAVPKKCSEFETHRHKGYDVFLITQDAMLIDHHVRRLVGRHVHVKRPFGSKFANVFEWEGVHNPNDFHDRKKALTAKFFYPKELFGMYHSADIHTYKSSLPWKKLLLIPALLAVIVGLAFLLKSVLLKGGAEKTPAASLATLPVPAAPVPQALLAGPEKWSPEYLAARIHGLDYTAPMYDSVTVVKTFPKIDGCMLIEFSHRPAICRCNTQQGTRARVTEQQCRAFVADGGWFDFSGEDEKGGSGGERRPLHREEDIHAAPAEPMQWMPAGANYFVTETVTGS